MNKLELIEKLAEQHGLSKAEARCYVDLFFDSISAALTKGQGGQMTRFKCIAPVIRSGVIWAVAFLFCLISPVPVLAATTQTYQAKVIGIADGYTITVLQGTTQIKVRLYGIDCPERKQAFGSKAKQFTSGLVFGQTVKFEPVTKDRYGRIVAWVYVEKMLERGTSSVRSGAALQEIFIGPTSIRHGKGSYAKEGQHMV